MISKIFVLLLLGACLQLAACRKVKCEPGKKSGSLIFHRGDGLYYHRNLQRRHNLYLKCIFYDSSGCQGRAVFNRRDGRGLVPTAEHTTHLPDPYYAGELRLRHRIIERCRSLEYLPYRTIVRQERRRWIREVRARVPLVRLRTAMRNARLSSYPSPAPRNLRALSDMLRDPRHEVLTMTEDGDDNIFSGCVTDTNGDHHVIFTSQRMLNFMANRRILYADGTFKVVPTIDDVSQILVLVTTWRYHIIPLVWILMSSRTEIAYEAVLGMVYNMLPGRVNVRRIISDFERGLQNALDTVFGVRLQGCLFHLCRAFVAEAVALNLGYHLRNTPEVTRIIRLCCAISLLPRHLMTVGYMVIVREARGEGRAIFRLVRPFFQYVQHRWLRNDRRRRSMSVHGSFHRTNNACESHNRVLRDVVDRYQNIYIFIHRLLQLEQEVWTDILTLTQGLAASRQRRASAVHNDQQLLRLEQDLQNPPGPLNEAVLNFLVAACNLLHNIVEDAIDEHRL